LHVNVIVFHHKYFHHLISCIFPLIGIENENVLPSPYLLSTLIFPPCNSTNFFVITSPSPVPPYFLVVPEYSCSNSLNSFTISSSLIPMPVSETERIYVDYPEIVNINKFAPGCTLVCRHSIIIIILQGIYIYFLEKPRNHLPGQLKARAQKYIFEFFFDVWLNF
jgi:hypothetical protein